MPLNWHKKILTTILMHASFFFNFEKVFLFGGVMEGVSTRARLPFAYYMWQCTGVFLHTRIFGFSGADFTNFKEFQEVRLSSPTPLGGVTICKYAWETNLEQSDTAVTYSLILDFKLFMKLKLYSDLFL